MPRHERSFTLVALLVLGAISVVSAEQGSPQVAQVTKALQGKWEGVGAEAGWSMSFEGETWYAASGKQWYSGDFVLHPDQKPAGIDLIIRDCAGCNFLDRKSLAIFELDGDSLKVAGPEPGKPRAKRFEDDSNQLLRMTRAQ